MRRILPSAAVLLLLGACRDGGPLEDVQVTQAWLQDFQVDSFSLLVSGSTGDATLLYDTTSGATEAVPVDIRGWGLGVAFA